MIGILLAVIGAMTAKEYRVNLCLLIGAMVVVGGIVYHLTMMKCPYCGCSLAPEWGVILAVAVMGAFIIYFNDKKQ